MKHFIFKSAVNLLVGLIGLFLILWIVAIEIFLPEQIEKQLISYLKENCKSCELNIKKVNVSYLLNKVSFENVFFNQGHSDYQTIKATADMATLKFSLIKLLNKEVLIEKVKVDKPTVTITQGDLKGIHTKTREKPYLKLKIQDIEVEKGTFTYVRAHNGKKAPITVNNINLKISEIILNSDITTHGQAYATLEDSGKVDLKVSSQLFLETLNVDIDLKLKEQNLSEVNPYFLTNDGIELKGQLINGRSRIGILNNKITASVFAEYNNFDINFESKPDKLNPTEAFFSNIVANAKIKPKNTQDSQGDKVKTVELLRNPEESLIAFIFRGMKEAALDLATE